MGSTLISSTYLPPRPLSILSPCRSRGEEGVARQILYTYYLSVYLNPPCLFWHTTPITTTWTASRPSETWLRLTCFAG